jgi:hypothetical protein
MVVTCGDAEFLQAVSAINFWYTRVYFGHASSTIFGVVSIPAPPAELLPWG